MTRRANGYIEQLLWVANSPSMTRLRSSLMLYFDHGRTFLALARPLFAAPFLDSNISTLTRVRVLVRVGRRRHGNPTKLGLFLDSDIPSSRVGAYCSRNSAIRRQAGAGGTLSRRVRPQAARMACKTSPCGPGRGPRMRCS
jgi:hypothetical protein